MCRGLKALYFLILHACLFVCLLNQEEEKRQQELLAKKKAEEEARKALELKREQERERERELERERQAAAERSYDDFNTSHSIQECRRIICGPD